VYYIYIYIQEKDFVEVSKNFVKDTNLKMILLGHKNNYVKNSSKTMQRVLIFQLEYFTYYFQI